MIGTAFALDRAACIGGPTLTHALLEGSPAIDTGSCEDIDGQPIQTDQRGLFRIAPCDIGAFELDAVITTSEPTDTPGTHVLSPAYPNPFNPSARFTLSVSTAQRVTATLYDAIGRELSVLHSALLVDGVAHRFEIDGSHLPSGVYLVEVVAEHFRGQLRVTLVR